MVGGAGGAAMGGGAAAGAAGGATGGAGYGGYAGSGSGSGSASFTGVLGSLYALSSTDANSSSSYLHNHVATNDLNQNNSNEESSRLENQAEKESRDKQRQLQKSQEPVDTLTYSDELMDEMEEDAKEGKKPTSIWSPRRT